MQRARSYCIHLRNGARRGGWPRSYHMPGSKRSATRACVGELLANSSRCSGVCGGAVPFTCTASDTCYFHRAFLVASGCRYRFLVSSGFLVGLGGFFCIDFFGGFFFFFFSFLFFLFSL